MSTAMKLEKSSINSPKKRGKYTVCIVGCGRRGLPHACLFAEAGFKVIGVDTNQQVVNLMKMGRAVFAEPKLNALLKKHVKKGNLTATKDARKAASKSDFILIVVPTPIDQKRKPDYSYVEKACKDVGMGLRSGSLVIFASTTGPGVTETLVKKTLETASGLKAGVDFGLAYSPVRVISGQMLQDITSSSRVVGAVNEQSLKTACLVLSTIVKGELIKVRDMKTAEAVKLFENVYRDVNIGLANELARFCEKAGVDIIEVQAATNTQPHCHLLVPGIVGGHVPKDPYLLVEEAENVNTKLKILTIARKINDETLNHTVHLVRDALRLCGKTMRRAKVSVLGVSYCPNVKEPRGSSTGKLAEMLKKKGATVRVYDSLFSHKELTKLGYPAKRTLAKTVEGADCLVIAVGHDRFKRLNLKKIKFLVRSPAAIVDMGHVIDPEKAEKEGFIYRGLGRGLNIK
jgi:UDP-N-acetyl-D-mannosaminuronic acid dehydrogenase